jgi:hypothetical protein
MQYSMGKQSRKTMPIFIAAVCFITNISQMPIFVENSLTRAISIPIWILLLAVLILEKRIVFNHFPMFAVFICWLLFSYTLTLDIVTDKSYLSIALLYPFYLSFSIFFIGIILSRLLTYDDFLLLINSYIISALIVAINIFGQYIIGNDIYGGIYIYGPKNSVSQILITALVFLLVIRQHKSTLFMNSIKYLSALFLIVVLLFLKSRASIIGIPVAAALILGLWEKQYKLKKVIIGVIIIFSILMLNDNFYNITVNQVLGGGRNWSNLNDISSGRYYEWQMFPHLLKGFELFGIGRYKLESYPLSVILQFGILMGGLLIITTIWPAWWGYKKLDRSEPVNIAFIIIAILYFINGLFEQLAPFGPGTKCYMLWLMFGILYGNKMKNEITITQ